MEHKYSDTFGFCCPCRMLPLRDPTSIVPHEADRDTYIVLDDFCGRIGCFWRETDVDSAQIARR